MHADAQDMIATIEAIFAALGDNDRVRLNALLCEDFHAFENGVRVTGRPGNLRYLGVDAAQVRSRRLHQHRNPDLPEFADDAIRVGVDHKCAAPHR